MKSSFDEKVYQYALAHCSPEPGVLKRLREETAALQESKMQIPPEQGALMGLLAQALGARRAVEVGVFTGYSTLSVALGMPPDGRIVACDVSERFTQIARRYWREAGVEDKIDLRLAPAVKTLEALLADHQANAYDLAFIDADKDNYDTYYEHCLKLTRPGGFILVDNTLWGGMVATEAAQDADTRAIAALNDKIRADRRVRAVLLPLADGLTVARKL